MLPAVLFFGLVRWIFVLCGMGSVAVLVPGCWLGFRWLDLGVRQGYAITLQLVYVGLTTCFHRGFYLLLMFRIYAASFCIVPASTSVLVLLARARRE